MMLFNLQSPEILKKNQLIASAVRAIHNRTYGDRNPDLGPMLKCPVCERRHRGKVCEPIYAQGRKGSATEGIDLIANQGTRKGVFGAKQFARKRFHVHPSKRKLQLVQRTQQIFPENVPFFTNMRECMEESRDMAQRELKTERRRARRNVRRNQDVARRITAGLARPGSRPPLSVALVISDKTRQARRAKLDLRTAANAVMKEAEGGLAQS